MSRLLLALTAFLVIGCACPRGVPRPFDLPSDSFTFSNQLRWEYEFTSSGEVFTRKTEPAPDYSLRCFPMVRTAREFFYHARFRPDLPKATAHEYLVLVQDVIERNSRCPAEAEQRIDIPGFANLHDFSFEYGSLLKAQCGGATRSFLQRGNWRMVFPVTSSGQRKTAERFLRELRDGRLPAAHVYQFPNTALNHALLIYGVEETPATISFSAYDPNDPSHPALLTFNRETSSFQFERNRYFGGGNVRVYEVYRGVFF